MNKNRLVIGILLACITFASAGYTEVPLNFDYTGVYSNLTISEQTGDAYGIEMFIVHTFRGYYATIQMAEGWTKKPVIIPIEIRGGKIKFTAPQGLGGPSGDFSGIIDKEKIEGTFNSESEEVILKKGKSFWQL